MVAGGGKVYALVRVLGSARNAGCILVIDGDRRFRGGRSRGPALSGGSYEGGARSGQSAWGTFLKCGAISGETRETMTQRALFFSPLFWRA